MLVSKGSRPLVAICGGGEAGERGLADARLAGRLLAEAGAGVICGGLGGVMAAAAEGAAEGGGISVGLLPGWDAAEASDRLTVALPTGLGEMRNVLIVRAALAVIAIEGGPGTLTEIAFALRLGRPVAGIRTWDLRPPSSSSTDPPSSSSPAEPGIHRAASAEEAVAWVLAAVRQRV